MAANWCLLLYIYCTYIGPGAGDVLLHWVGSSGQPARPHPAGGLHTGSRPPGLHQATLRLHEPVRLAEGGQGPLHLAQGQREDR